MFPTIQLKKERLNAVNVINVFDEESDEASCAVPCIECEKRFFDEKEFIRHHELYHELEVQSMRETFFDEKEFIRHYVPYHELEVQ